MRTKLSAYNTVSAMLLQFINLIVNLILPGVMINVYGSAMNGLVSSIRQFIQYFTLVEAGLSGAAIYALYKPLAEKNKKGIDGILSAANRFYNISGYIFSCLVLLTAFIYPLFIPGQSINPYTASLLVIIIGATGALEFFAIGRYKVLFTADQKSYIISLINGVAVAINAIIIFVLATLHYDMIIVQAVALISFVARSVFFALYGKYKYSYIDYKATPDNKALDKRWDSFISQILGVVNTGTPIVVITIFCGLSEVSVFTIYNMVFGSVLVLLSTFNNGLTASFGDLLIRKEMDIFQRAYKQYEYLYYALLGWGYACASILVLPFVKIYSTKFSDANYVRPEVAALFVLWGLLYNIKTPQGMLVLSAGLYKETKYRTLTQAIIHIVFSVALAPRYGMVGVLIGAVLSNLYRCIDLIFYIPKVVTKLPPSMTIKRVIRMLVLFTICILPTLKLVRINPGSYITWLIWAIVIAIWCLVVFAVGNIIMERTTTKLVYIRLKGLISRK